SGNIQAGLSATMHAADAATREKAHPGQARAQHRSSYRSRAQLTGRQSRRQVAPTNLQHMLSSGKLLNLSRRKTHNNTSIVNANRRRNRALSANRRLHSARNLQI